MIYLFYFALTLMITVFITDRRQGIVIVASITFLFIGLSYPSGGDWIGYFVNYDCIINEHCQSGFIMFEPGYELLVTIFGVMGYQVVIITIALIDVLLIFSFAKRFENGAFIFMAMMCMFLWSVYIEAIRQSLALSLVVYSIYKLYSGNKKSFLLLIIIASTFHITALACLLFVIPLYSIKLGRVVSYALIILGFVFFALADKILELAIAIIPIGTIASEKLQFYLNSEQYKPQLSIGSGTILDVLLIFLVVTSFVQVKKRFRRENYIFYNVMLLGVCFYISFSILIGKMMPVLTRVGWYGFPFVITILYTNLGSSVFYKTYNKSKFPSNLTVVKSLIGLYFVFQIIRPFIYDYSNYNILHQESIFQNLNSLDDDSLRIAAKEKCHILSNMGYSYLCSL